MTRRSLRHLGTALLLLVACCFGQATWTLASVTGGLTGTVVDADTSAPIAGAQVTATSPSQSATVYDRRGGALFVSDPRTRYVHSYRVEERLSADQRARADRLRRTVQTVTVRMPKTLKTIARVTARPPGALVKSGTTADVYSINAAAQAGYGRARRRRPDQSGVLGDLDRSRRLRDSKPDRVTTPRSTSAAATTTRWATSSTAFR